MFTKELAHSRHLLKNERGEGRRERGEEGQQASQGLKGHNKHTRKDPERLHRKGTSESRFKEAGLLVGGGGRERGIQVGEEGRKGETARPAGVAQWLSVDL